MVEKGSKRGQKGVEKESVPRNAKSQPAAPSTLAPPRKSSFSFMARNAQFMFHVFMFHLSPSAEPNLPSVFLGVPCGGADYQTNPPSRPHQPGNCQDANILGGRMRRPNHAIR